MSLYPIGIGHIKALLLGGSYLNSYSTPLWHLIIVVVTVGLCCCIADIYIILRSVVTASFSSMVQKRVREVMKND